MRIGVPKEIKVMENRVGMTPGGVSDLVRHGHTVQVETGAGEGSGFADEEYRNAGAEIVATAAEAWSSEMVIKVKEPLEPEYAYFRKDLLLYTYLHLAAEGSLTKALVDSKVTAIAYETVQLADGSLPLLTPMSEVAGRMAVQVGARFLEKPQGGRGVLLGGVPGVAPARVSILGGGIVGINSAKMAVGLGASVTILDTSAARLRYLDDVFMGRVKTLMSNAHNIAHAVRHADLFVGGVLIPGAKAPHLVTEEMVQTMQPGSVIVDVAIDQGGCIETIDRVTYHDNPTYERHGVVHYSVGNMPGAVPRTSTLALTNATLPYAVQLANKGWRAACVADQALALGMNTYAGQITCEGVATSLGYEYCALASLL
ncbi:MAG TPA: alanine dehydrogenase [Deltaproteobacteria bacterium]|jgi:alanine dehydrogenase|nr:alanine dehydrogenase [Candidatus Lambdaproteobacteria bacterium]HIL16450.1 alanine dehydrogenase [Deltaproteobacteria bacterium]